MNESPRSDRELPSLDHYQLLDCIGRGGMGLVYRARDTRLDRLVAIKCLRAELYEPAYRERFRREAMLLARLNHPNIVQIYDYLETDEQLALVMELVDGRNLQTWVREHLVSLQARMQWLAQIAEGLAVAHDAGIIHRDLKAENILLNARGEAKISDFGIARTADSNLTINEYIAGSYCSMSPEQAMGEELDFRSDLFSFGILAYQLLCGSHPFGKTDNKLQLMQRIISHPPLPPAQANPALPPDVCEYLKQLLSKNPDNRPQQTRLVANAFAAFARLPLSDEVPGEDTELLIRPAVPATKPSPAATGAGQSKKRAWLILPAALLVILGVVFLLGKSFGWWSTGAPRYLAIVPPAGKGAVEGVVYDALQQSAVQLNNFYLIPPEQLEDIDGDYETLQRATGADELLAADVRCQQEACTISLSRLAAVSHGEGPVRLRVIQTRSFDVLRDQYLAMADIVQTAIGQFYAQNIVNGFEGITEEEYATFIEVALALRNSGASDQLLERLDTIPAAVNRTPALRGLYTQIAVDLYYESGHRRYLEKLKRLYRATAATTRDPAYLYDLFSVQIAEGELDAAGTTLKQLAGLNINRIRLLELEADLQLSANDFPEAIATYEKLLKLKTSAHNYYNLSLAYWYAGDTGQARQALEQAIGLSPSFFKAHRLQGAIALTEGDPATAISSYASILEKKSDDISSISNLGIGHLLIGEYQDAAERFRQAVQMAPYNSTYLLNHADAESLAGNRGPARELYRQVIELAVDPGNREHLRNRIQAYAHLGQFSEAIQALQTLQRVDPHNIDTLYTSAMVYALAGDHVSALVNVENALTSNLSRIWFNFSWFDPLCQLQQFPQLLARHGTSARCDQWAKAGD